MNNPWARLDPQLQETTEQMKEALELQEELAVAKQVIDIFRHNNVEPAVAIYILAKLTTGMIATGIRKDNQKNTFELIVEQMRSWLKP